MSARITLGSTLAGLVLLIVIGVIVITGSKANEDNAIAAKQSAQRAEEQSKQNNEDIQTINKTLTNFVDQWSERVRIGNTNTNNTQQYILDGVARILETVEANFANLTAHRQVTNATFQEIEELQNQTNILISAFNATNEEERGKAVDNIINQLHKDHIIIMKGLNISKTYSNTESFDAIQKLKQQLDELERNQPPGLSKNEPQGPKS